MRLLSAYRPEIEETSNLQIREVLQLGWHNTDSDSKCSFRLLVAS